MLWRILSRGDGELFMEKEGFLDSLDKEELSGFIIKACGDVGDYDKSLFYRECLHGLGHGLMFLANMDFLKSLDFCNLFEVENDIENCYAGVFMENTLGTTINPGHTSPWLKEEDPLYPCCVVDEKYQEICYKHQASYFYSLADGDVEEIIELCQRVPESFQKQCFYVLGGDQASWTRDLSQMKKVCDLTDTPTHKDACIDGVSASLVSRYIGDPSLVIDFCLGVDGRNKATCYFSMGKEIETWGLMRSEKERICSQIKEREYKDICIKGSISKRE